MTTDGTYRLTEIEDSFAEGLPPLTLPQASAHSGRPTDLFPRLGRLACVAAALALPAFGIALADTVHRTREPRAYPAAAPLSSYDGTAARHDRRSGEMAR